MQGGAEGEGGEMATKEWSERYSTAGFEGGGKGCRWPLEGSKGKEMDSQQKCQEK